VLTVALSLLLSLASLTAPPGQVPRPPAPGGGPGIVYQPPLEAPVADPFRAPPNPYAAGNRGIEYATLPGTPVRAVADGTVVFAGPVAGSLHVTVLHADGIRTSYSFLAEILVTTGQVVARGQPVGRSGSRLHLGARTGPRWYIDPATLWSGPPHVYLVPVGGSGDQGYASDNGGAQDLSDVSTGPEPTAALAAGSVQLGALVPLR